MQNSSICSTERIRPQEAIQPQSTEASMFRAGSVLLTAPPGLSCGAALTILSEAAILIVTDFRPDLESTSKFQLLLSNFLTVYHPDSKAG